MSDIRENIGGGQLFGCRRASYVAYLQEFTFLQYFTIISEPIRNALDYLQVIDVHHKLSIYIGVGNHYSASDHFVFCGPIIGSPEQDNRLGSRVFPEDFGLTEDRVWKSSRQH
jgi:hypothetical protein